MNKTLAFIILFLFNFFAFSETPESMWRHAFKEFDQAEIHFKKAEYSKADSAYSTALAQFLKISVDYPDWETSSVNYRANECKDKISEIKNLQTGKEKTTKTISVQNEDLLKIRAERDKYAKAMLKVYKENKKNIRELEVTKALLKRAQMSAGHSSQMDSELEKTILEKRKLELTIKGLEKVLEEAKNQKANSSNQEIKKLQVKIDDILLASQKKQRELEATIENNNKDLLEKNNSLMDQKRLYAELKKISSDSEIEKKKYLDQINKQNIQITKLNKDLNSLKNTTMNLRSSLSIAQKSASTSVDREKTTNAKLFKQIEALQTKNIGLEGEIQTLKQRMIKSSDDTDKTVLKSEIDKVNKSLDLERKKSAQMKTKHDKDLLALKKIADKTKTEYAELEIKVNNLSLENKKLLVETSKARTEKNTLALKNTQLKEQLIERETSFVNQLKTKSAQQAEEIKKLNKDLKEKSDLNKIYEARLDSSNIAMASLNAELSKLMKTSSAAPSNKENDAEKLELITKLESSEKLNKKLNKEIISLRQRFIRLNAMSGQKDDEIISRYVKLKKAHEELQKDFKNLVNRIPQEGQVNKGFTDESTENITRKVETLIYDAYKASNEGKHQVALGLYSQALELDSKNLDALMRTGVLYYQLGQLSEAERYLNQAFYQNPDDANILIPLAKSVLDKADYHLGISLLSRAVALKPDNDELRVNLGVALQALGWEKAALAEMEKAYEINDKNAQTALNLAVLYLSQTPKKVNQAKIMYDKALAMGANKSPLLEELLK
ncbi:tetratricopeptide repeat protein [Lentisphaera marina]|uniref:tetratricopeptide repeat protein n=1 Tax=Lentisphaera marina TaxID=1111041 RepID=UPI0023673B09|nr:tetratricopeptide repeat protein [Lentisphaera marina]MDD7984881.1 tetratricopeptide repeat protein [Lentisphaera marina]